MADHQYQCEYVRALALSQSLGLHDGIRLLSAKPIDPDPTLKALLEYFDRHEPNELVGQTVAISLALVPLLLRRIGVPFEITIGWVELQGKDYCRHDEQLISRFLAAKERVWLEDGLPFHLWLTSPAMEIIDVTFAMNLGSARTREQCARRIVYRNLRSSGDPIYHPTLVGPGFFERIGVIN